MSKTKPEMKDSSTLKPKAAGSVQKIRIPAEYVGQRLDNYLINYLKGVPRSLIYRIIRSGEVRVNKGRIKAGYRIVGGEEVRIPPIRQGEVNADTITINPNVLSRLEKLLSSRILYEDEDFLVLNKPAGMAVHGGSGVDFGVIEAFRHFHKNKHLELVHRLDRDTSGCLVIAKKRSSLREIHSLFQNNLVQKTYWALVKGSWSKLCIEVEAPLKKNQLKSGERHVQVRSDGQPSLTEFKIIKRSAKVSWIEAKPVTGRTHQIRVHALHVGHPIVGDDKYGDKIFNAAMKAEGVGRLFLHAQKITLPLPGWAKPFSVEAPLDDDMNQVLNTIFDAE